MPLSDALKQTMVRVCDAKIEQKGANVGVSFYAFFANKNTNPDLLMQAAHWWIIEQRLDHFEKALKIKSLI
jgi:Family of unknown function (DUF6500)